MMRRAFTMVVVGSVNSPFRGMTKLRATHLSHLRHRFFEWRRHVHLCHELMSLSDEELHETLSLAAPSDRLRVPRSA